MRRFFAAGMLIALLSSFFGCKEDDDYPPRTQDKLVDKITIETAEKLLLTKNLRLCGVGSGMMDDIHMLAMSFDYYKEVELNEARELVVLAMEEYLSAINNCDELRPYLREYPFTAKSAEIRIFFRYPDNGLLKENALVVAGSVKNIITYDIDHPDNDTLKTIASEPYSEALDIVMSQRNITQKEKEPK